MERAHLDTISQGPLKKKKTGPLWWEKKRTTYAYKHTEKIHIKKRASNI